MPGILNPLCQPAVASPCAANVEGDTRACSILYRLLDEAKKFFIFLKKNCEPNPHFGVK